MRPAAAALAVLLASGGPAAAESLVVALSADNVKINSNFTGTGITVFGAIERDAETVSRSGDYDVAIVMRGPPETVVTRRKDRLAGIWINRAARTFEAVPSFYSLQASRALDDMAAPLVLERSGLGLEHLAASLAPADAGASDFRQAFIRLKQKAGLYSEEAGTVTSPGAGLFQATVPVPANIPVGVYTIGVFLFRSGSLLASTERSLEISKTGFEQLMFETSRSASFAYALAMIVIALFVGWLAGVIFRRD